MPAPTINAVNAQALATSLSSNTYSITVPSGLTNSALVVCIHFVNTSENDYTGTVTVKWQGSGGTSLALASGAEGSYFDAGNRSVYTGWYYLVSPTADTNDIYWSCSTEAISKHAITYYILENVDQTTPLNATGNGGNSAASLVASLTGTSTNSLTLYGWSMQRGSQSATVSGATEQTDVESGTGFSDGTFVTATEAGASGSQDATCSFTTAEEVSFGAIQIEGTSGGTTYNQSAAGTLTTAGAIVRASAKPLAGALTSAGSVVKSTAKSFAGALTSAGSVARSTGKALAGTVSSAGTIARSTSKALSGTVTTSGAITRAISKTVEGTLTTAGTIARAVSKSLAGAVSFAGALAAQAIEAATGIVNLLSQARDWSLTSKARDWTLTAQARIKDFTSRSRDN